MKIKFSNGYAVGFKMAISEHFKDALTRERFSLGDIFYNTPSAYEEKWEDALQHIDCCFQVTAVTSGQVDFNVLRPNQERTMLCITGRITEPVTDFIERLRSGSIEK